MAISQATKNKAIGAVLVFAVYYFTPKTWQPVKASALGVLGVMAAAYVPYVNGTALGEGK